MVEIHNTGSPARKDPISNPTSTVRETPTVTSLMKTEASHGPVTGMADPGAEPSPNEANRNAASRQLVVADPDPGPQPSLILPGRPRHSGKRVIRPLRVVIDAGHGGHDSGTLGPGGIEEKDVVLDVALRTGQLLHDKFGAEVLYTRSDDTFIPLETRTAIANNAGADLFLSIHANSSDEDEARGVETYYLNPAANARAAALAARENNLPGQQVGQISEAVRRLSLRDRVEQSRDFAQAVNQKLFLALRAGNPDLKDRGIKRAPFFVLLGAQMPAVLAEISFLTNEKDALKLSRPAYRQRIAAALEAGVEHYARTRKSIAPATRFPAAAELAMAPGPRIR
jgi:N-acetylmuramoyl-L-alanine amidase